MIQQYSAGDIVIHQLGGQRRRVLVGHRHATIKNGMPGFEGIELGDGDEPTDTSVWGYDDEIVGVEPGPDSVEYVVDIPIHATARYRIPASSVADPTEAVQAAIRQYAKESSAETAARVHPGSIESDEERDIRCPNITCETPDGETLSVLNEDFATDDNDPVVDVWNSDWEKM